MLELIAGIVVAFVAVGAVLQPMLVGGGALGRPGGRSDEAVEFEDIEESASPKIQALLALREIEFDRATGKLSDEDYHELKTKYSRVALEAIRAEEEGTPARGGETEDAAEALVRRIAVGGLSICPACGPRPEVDAVFCSDCGKPLSTATPSLAAPPGFCESCGSRLSERAKFCAECGAQVNRQAAASTP